VEDAPDLLPPICIENPLLLSVFIVKRADAGDCEGNDEVVHSEQLLDAVVGVSHDLEEAIVQRTHPHLVH